MFYEVDPIFSGPRRYTSCSPFPQWCSSSCTPGAKMITALTHFARRSGSSPSSAARTGRIFAHKAAVAAAMEPMERDLAAVISQYLVSQQRAHGGFADVGQG